MNLYKCMLYIAGSAISMAIIIGANSWLISVKESPFLYIYIHRNVVFKVTHMPFLKRTILCYLYIYLHIYGFTVSNIKINSCFLFAYYGCELRVTQTYLTASDLHVRNGL